VSAEPRALTKGGIVGYHRNSRNKVIERGTDLNDLMSKSESKPWKKHNNKKKEKNFAVKHLISIKTLIDIVLFFVGFIV